MIGQDFQDKLDAIVLDLQTKGKGQLVKIAFRGADNDTFIMPLSSDANGVVNAQELSNLQAVVNNMKPFADNYETQRSPVQAALEDFKTAQEPHQGLFDAAAVARKNLSDALEADQTYQAAKEFLENLRQDNFYIDAVNAYKANNVSENFGNLSDAKGKYAV